ncbi:carbon-nitrogen hydrolase family protein [Halanaerobium kushneri]|uniref:Predicted amidohydrolase n=1 Tax=Halanaerobium kushneri TaxID=56779 RepID=A0A1N6RVR1_9FIRM|nr:carbon-nitrogen hydrolase family protein [Halanaerobium kushneri]SIQ32871.1 Predicted amidohydrolase [Halanaerobium kushneri]
MKVKIALGQIEPSTLNKEDNFIKMKKYIDQAANQNVNLIIFPELSLTGYNCGDAFFEVAEEIPGPTVNEFEDIAKNNDIYIIWGMPEKGIEGVLYNDAVLVGPEGYIGKWRKHTLPGHATDKVGPGAFPDRRYFRAGSKSPIFKTKIGNIGMMVCYDIYFPEISRLLTLKGADLLVGISGSPSFEKDIFEPLVKARAMENAIWYAYCNLGGKEGETEYWGGSTIIGPGDKESKVPGEPIICKADYDKEDLIIGTIDYDKTGEFRPYFPVLRDIRLDFYEELYKIAEEIT